MCCVYIGERIGDGGIELFFLWLRLGVGFLLIGVEICFLVVLCLFWWVGIVFIGVEFFGVGVGFLFIGVFVIGDGVF